MSMKLRKILFRTDSSSTIGTGHIMRDLVLASRYKDAKVIFATQNLEGNINYKIKEAGYELIFLNSNDVDEFVDVVEKYSADMVVIDHYGIDAKYEQSLKEKTGVKILAFDDTYEKHHCDILLNHNISADASRYKELVPKECELWCGAEHTLLREEFMQPFPPKQKSVTTKVLVAMGGVDSKALNIEILKVLEQFSNLEIDLVTTQANKNLAKLQAYVANKAHITLHINTNKMALLMHNADFGIFTPSVTVNEAHFMKLPFIAIQTEENQKDIYHYLYSHGYEVLASFDPQKLQKKVEVLVESNACELIAFSEMTLDEAEMVLVWRNSKNVKKWMYNQENITLEEHLNYIKTLSKREDRAYFLLKGKRGYLGVVDVTNITKESAEIGIYANPNTQGFGKVLMRVILAYAFEQLQLQRVEAHVYEKNKKAIALYERFGFKIYDTKEDKHGTILQMELKNAD